MAIKKNWSGIAPTITDGNFVAVLVPAAEVTNPESPSAALLNGETSLDVTYDLVADSGWNHTPGNEEIAINRLTLRQALTLEGRQNDTLEVTYGWSATPEVDETQIDDFLVEGERYYAFTRWGVDHDTDFDAGDTVDVFPVTCGRKRKVAPSTGAEQQKTVALKPFGTVLDDVAVAA